MRHTRAALGLSCALTIMIASCLGRVCNPAPIRHLRVLPVLTVKSHQTVAMSVAQPDPAICVA